MVSVELIGGLGNQMFQIAACIGYAIKNELPYHIPIKTQNSHSATPYFTHLQNSDWDESLPTIYYQEPNFHYDEIPVLGGKLENIILKGYFQSYKYFEGLNFGRIFYTGLAGSNIIPNHNINKLAVHVRKGDYELYPTKHPIVSVDYISGAINYIKNELRIEDISFFSDNPDWCAQFAHMRNLSCNVVFEYDPVKAFLKLMSHNHFVLSNSTFGYWAAVMNHWLYKGISNKSLVICPEKWFGPDYAHLDTKDMCPPEWIKM